MKLAQSSDQIIDTYRVQLHWDRIGFAKRRPWSRTWQAEWSGCAQAPRAWTRRGLLRKAGRWLAREQRNAGPYSGMSDLEIWRRATRIPLFKHPSAKRALQGEGQ